MPSITKGLSYKNRKEVIRAYFEPQKHQKDTKELPQKEHKNAIIGYYTFCENSFVSF